MKFNGFGRDEGSWFCSFYITLHRYEQSRKEKKKKLNQRNPVVAQEHIHKVKVISEMLYNPCAEKHQKG